MKTTRFDPRQRTLLKAIALTAGAAALGGCAATGARSEPEEGFDYRPAPEPAAARDASGRIDVAEFFWFGCPHCNAIEPLVKAWRARLPDDVAFRKVHPGLAARWVPHQRLFCTLREVGAPISVDTRIFAAIHDEGRALDTPEEAIAAAAAAGVDRGSFERAWRSSAVEEAMRRADALARALGVQGVPTFVVAGRFVTSPSMAGTYADTLRVVDALVSRVRRGT